LLDARTGVIVTSFDDGTLVGEGADGCVVGFAAGEASGDDVAAGLISNEDTDRVDRRFADRVLAIAADGTAAIDSDGRTVSWVDLVGGEVTELVSPVDTGDTTGDTTTTTRRTTTTTTTSTGSPIVTADRDTIVAAAFATR
jgi:hypothetical protein